jgi:hypothetical protein
MRVPAELRQVTVGVRSNPRPLRARFAPPAPLRPPLRTTAETPLGPLAVQIFQACLEGLCHPATALSAYRTPLSPLSAPVSKPAV